jgi:hypothetical protein
VPVTEAIKEGKVVGSVPVDYEYNEIQRLNESGELKDIFTIKRLEQYSQTLKEMGDPLWEKFFQEAEEALNEMQKENKKESADNVELSNEQKKSVLKTFFKIR